MVDLRIQKLHDLTACIRGTTTNADAAKLKPSEFASRVGDPEVLHDDTNHDRIRRNSVPSHQEQLSGI